jgi:gluconate 5-dehydrogenase
MTVAANEMFSLGGYRAVVTGGNSGIGRAAAEALAEAGASVVLLARDLRTLGATRDAISDRGGRCAAISADLSDRHAIAAAAEDCAGAFGEPDILVNAAGLNLRPEMSSVTTETWDTTLAVNLTAPFLLGQRFAPGMAGKGYGRIINFGSQQSLRAFGNSGAYGVSKAGVVALTRSQAEAWSRYGVCSNAIIPGFIRTPMTEKIFSDPERAASMAKRTMAGRNGTVDDMRGVVVFLASRASGYVTGQAICVDGGFSAT